MKKLFNLFWIGAIMAGGVSCSSNDTDSPSPATKTEIELSRSEAEIVNGQIKFAFNLFDRIVSAGEGENVVIAPYSTATALSMLVNGAQGKELNQLLNALNADDIQAVNSLNKRLLLSLPALDANTTIGIANSIWVHPSGEFKPDFSETLNSFYMATASKTDMTKPEGAAVVNSWCNEATAGMIPEIISETESVLAAIINANYFKGSWSEMFDKKNTSKEDFTFGNNVSRVDMMKKTGFDVAETGGHRIARLNYGNGAFRMTIIPSTDKVSTTGIAAELANGLWQSVRNATFGRLGASILMPRFKVSFADDIMGIFENWLPDAFGEEASYPGVGKATLDEDFKIDAIEHRVVVEVSEEGTKAAGVTSLEDMDIEVGPDAPQVDLNFYVNRPFVFIIDETSTGTILFAGAINRL